MKGKNLSAIFGGGATGGQNGGLGGLLQSGLGGLLGGGAAGGILSGGLGDLLKQFQNNGLSDKADSWVSTGETSRSSHQNLNVRLAKSVFLG